MQQGNDPFIQDLVNAEMNSCSIPSDALRVPDHFYDIDPDGDMLLAVNYSRLMTVRSDCDVHKKKGKAT